MTGLFFGTGGTPHSARTPSTVAGIERIAELGLGCMEIEFVQGVRMGEAGARQVAEAATREGVRLSAHAPYFINLNAHEPEKIRASQERLLQTARIGSLCGVESIVFHAAFYLGDPSGEVYSRVRQYLEEVLDQLKQESNRVWVRPEVLGKPSQFGTVDEILNWHARTGKYNSYQEFTSVLLQIKDRLGGAALGNMHIHVAGIAYGKKGETKHLNLRESDFQYDELLQALKDYDARGLVVCESPNLEEDALLLQATYKSLTERD